MITSFIVVATNSRKDIQQQNLTGKKVLYRALVSSTSNAHVIHLIKQKIKFARKHRVKTTKCLQLSSHDRLEGFYLYIIYNRRIFCFARGIINIANEWRRIDIYFSDLCAKLTLKDRNKNDFVERDVSV